MQLLQAKVNGRYSSPEVARVEASAAEARAAYAAAQDLSATLQRDRALRRHGISGAGEAGSYVNGGELLVQVANLEKVRVRAFVDETGDRTTGKGPKSCDEVGRDPGPHLGRHADPRSNIGNHRGNAYRGRDYFEIDNSDRKLLPNVNVNVSIISARHDDALTVSREAVHDVDGKRYVYKIEDEKILAQEVQTGLSSLTRVKC